MSRSTLATLITRTRRLIQDTAGGSQHFDDDEIQEVLDQRRDDVRYLSLDVPETRLPNGVVAYYDAYTPGDLDNWEEDVALVDQRYAPLTPTTSDYQVGHWTFTTSIIRPVYLTGKTFDIYAAAADLLERWAAGLKLKYDFSSKDQSLKRSQPFDHMLEMAQRYRGRQRVVTVKQVRDDVH